MEMSSRKATQCFVVELGFHGRAATASLDCGSKSELKGKGQLLFSVLRSCLTMPSAYVFRHATDFVFDCFTWEMKYNYYVKILKLLPVRFPSLKIPKYINIKTFHFTNFKCWTQNVSYFNVSSTSTEHSPHLLSYIVKPKHSSVGAKRKTHFGLEGAFK